MKISEQQATEAKGRIEPHDPIDKNGEHTAIASELLERVRVAVGGEYSGNVFCVSHTLIARQKGEYVQFYFRQPFSDDGWEQWDKLMKNERVAYRK